MNAGETARNLTNSRSSASESEVVRACDVWPTLTEGVSLTRSVGLAGRLVSWRPSSCRTIAKVTAVSMLAAGLSAVTMPAASAASPPTVVAEAPDVARAQVLASEQHRPIEVTGMRTADSKTVVNVDGTLTTQVADAPMNVQKSDGTWTPVDTTLSVGSDGRLHAGALPFEMSLSNGGDDTLADVTPAAGERARWNLERQVPVPQVDGATARYVDVRPGIDLIASATASGFELSYVLKQRPVGALNLTFPLELSGLSPGTDKNGDPQFSKGGRAMIKGSPAVMWDAATDPASSPPGRRLQVPQTVTSSSITLNPSRDFLQDPHTTFPVTIDPFYGLTFHYGTYVYQVGPNTNYDGSSYFRSGLATTTGTAQRTLLRFQIPTSLTGTHILDASLRMYLDSATSCAASTVIRTLASSFDPTTVTYASMPGISGPYDATTFASGCTGAWQTLHMGDVVDTWVNGGATNNGFALTGVGNPETDVNSNKVWRSENFPGGAYKPTLSITYNRYPNTVAGRSLDPSTSAGGINWTNVLTPTLYGQALDPDGGNTQVQFEVWNGARTSLISYSSGSAWPSMGPQQRLIGWPTGTLTNGTAYSWRARGYDGTDYSKAWSSWLDFKVDTTRPTAPTIGSSNYPADAWTLSGASPTFTLSATDTNSGVSNYVYTLDGATPDTPTAGALTLPSLPDGWHHLRVLAVDKAGNEGPVTDYQFGTQPGFTAPTAATSTIDSVTVSSMAAAGTAVTYNYRLSRTTSWTQIPASDVTQGGVPISGWPLVPTAGHVPTDPGVAASIAPDVVWHVSQTLNSVDGVIELQACYSGVCGVVPISITFSQLGLSHGVDSVELGPASVNMLTGNVQLSEDDAAVSAYATSLAVGRYFNTLAPSTPGPVGNGWTLSGDATTDESEWASLVDNGAQVVLTDADGGELVFAKSGSAYAAVGPEAGDGWSLTAVGSPVITEFDLRNSDGDLTTFTVGASIHSYVVNTIADNGRSASASHTTAFGSVLGQTRVILAPAPAGVNCQFSLLGGVLVWVMFQQGCRALEFNYAGSLLQSVSLRFNASGTQTLIDLACYQYNGSNQLTAEWDPRDDSLVAGNHPVQCGAVASSATTYEYDAMGRVSALTDAKTGRTEFTYTATKVTSIARVHTNAARETTNIVYAIPLTPDPSNAAYRPDMTAAAVQTWGQTDTPASATAVFDVNQPASSGDLRWATVHYLDASGREVNQGNYAGPSGASGWHIRTSEFDSHDNRVRSLTPANRELALDSASAAAYGLTGDSAANALALSTQSGYDYSGWRDDLLDVFGPYTSYIVAGQRVLARLHGHYTYDKSTDLGHPTAVPNLHLVTQITQGASLSPTATSTNETDYQTTEYDYALSATDNIGWTLGKPMAVVIDPGGLSLKTTTHYDATTGESTELTRPSGRNGSKTIVIPYTASANATDPQCGLQPPWASLPCKVEATDSQQTATMPSVTTKFVRSYDYLLRPIVFDEINTSSGGTTTRTTTSTYANAGYSELVSGTTVSGGLGPQIPPVHYGYNTVGLRTTVSIDGTAEIPSQTSSIGYDDFGRVISYSQFGGASGFIANDVQTVYGTDGRIASISNAKLTRTLTYNAGGEYRPFPTGMSVQVNGSSTSYQFNDTYDANGRLATQYDPAGRTMTFGYNAIGDPTSMTVTDATGEVLKNTVQYDVHNRQTATQSSVATHDYGYDGAGRLIAADNRPTGYDCASRAYMYDANGNRTQEKIFAAATDGGCATATTLSTISHTYDDANRLLAANGESDLQYDAAGRMSVLPATAAGGTAASAAYFSDDQARSLTQAGSTYCWSLDTALRQSVMKTYAGGTCGSTATATQLSFFDTPDGDAASWIADDASGSTWNAYAPSLATQLLLSVSSSGVGTLQYNGLNGVALATSNVNGTNLTLAPDFDEFGLASSANSLKYGYFGAEQRGAAPAAGLVLDGIRLYAPSLGLFTSVDPASALSLSDYRYSAGDPVNFRDADGLQTAPELILEDAELDALIAAIGELAVLLIVLAVVIVAALLLIAGINWLRKRVHIEYLGTWLRAEKQRVPKKGGVYILILTRSRFYVGQTGNFKDRFYAHLRKFKYNSSKDILGISAFHASLDWAPDKPLRELLECALHHWLTSRGFKVVNDTRYIPGC